jgi:hypothetical protein
MSRGFSVQLGTRTIWHYGPFLHTDTHLPSTRLQMRPSLSQGINGHFGNWGLAQVGRCRSSVSNQWCHPKTKRGWRCQGRPLEGFVEGPSDFFLGFRSKWLVSTRLPEGGCLPWSNIIIFDDNVLDVSPHRPPWRDHARRDPFILHTLGISSTRDLDLAEDEDP